MLSIDISQKEHTIHFLFKYTENIIYISGRKQRFRLKQDLMGSPGHIIYLIKDITFKREMTFGGSKLKQFSKFIWANLVVRFIITN